MIKKLLIFLFVLISCKTKSQDFYILFGDSLQSCYAKSIVVKANSLAVLVSCIDSNNIHNNYIYEFDSLGQYLNTSTIALSNFSAERMIPSSNSYIVCGSSHDFTGDVQAVLLKLDSSYNLLWDKQFGSIAFDESFSGICSLPDGSVVGSGYTKNPSGTGNAFYAGKTDSAGNSSWEKIYSTPLNSTSDQIISLDDYTMVISGDRMVSVGQYSNTTIRIDSAGAVIWEHESLNPYNNGCKNDLLTSDGYILVVGESATAGNPTFDPNIVKVDTSGNERWGYTYSGSPSSTEALFDICEINMNRFYAAGYGVNPVAGSVDVFIMEIDSAGTELYRTYIGDSTAYDSPNDIIPDNNKQGIYICGRTSKNGKTRASLIYRSLSGLQSVTAITSKNSLFLYPNPTSGKVILPASAEKQSIRVYDLQGRILWHETIKDNYINLEELQNGLYIISVTGNNITHSYRVNIIR